jgi:hypothetical protein
MTAKPFESSANEKPLRVVEGANVLLYAGQSAMVRSLLNLERLLCVAVSAVASGGATCWLTAAGAPFTSNAYRVTTFGDAPKS